MHALLHNMEIKVKHYLTFYSLHSFELKKVTPSDLYGLLPRHRLQILQKVHGVLSLRHGLPPHHHLQLMW
jgi:hypothetical protein